MYKVIVLRMANMIWKETKQEPGTAEPDNMLGCCLISFHFLLAILSMSTVLKSYIHQQLSPIGEYGRPH